MIKLDAALDYVEIKRWWIFPCWWIKPDGRCACNSPDCTSPGKHPIGALAQHGVWDASNDRKVIRHWWKQYPEANIAVHCGPSGFIAMDLDSYKEIYQPQAVDVLLSPEDMDTVTNLTPSPGQHLLFSNDVKYGNHRKLFPPGIDIRAWGAYIMIPPSNHLKGIYQWEADNSPFDKDMREVPAKVRALLDQMEAQVTEARERRKDRDWEALPELATVAEALSFIPNWSLSDREGGLEYRDWLSILMAVHSAYPGEEGIDVCEAWSPGKPNEIADKWKSFNGAGYTLGTLEHWARKGGWTGTFANDWKAGFDPDCVEITVDPASGEAATDSPHQTYPYLARDGRIVVLKDTKEGVDRIRIADFTATITQTVTDEYGDQTFVIGGVGVRGGPFTVEVPAGEYGNAARLKGYLDGVSPFDGVYPRMAEHLGPAIKRLTLGTESRRRFNRTGWHGGKFLIPGREAIGTEIALSEKAQRAYTLGTQVDPALAVEALEKLIEGIGQCGTVFMAYVLAPPLAGLAGLHSQKYGLFVRGITGSMKTTCSQLSMAVWGSQFVTEQLYEKIGEHNATSNGIISRAAELRDLPMMIDNFKPNTAGRENIVSLVHAIMEGYTKTRATRSGANARSLPLLTWPLMTGEDTPATDTAALARLIVLEMESREGIDQPAITRVQQIGHNLAAIGAAWLDLLESPEAAGIVRTFVESYEAHRRTFAEHIRTNSPKAENMLRSASNFALNLAAWEALGRLPLIANIIKKYEAQHISQLFALAGDVGRHTAESLEAHKYLNILYELITTRRVYVRPLGETEAPPFGTPVIGWYAEDGICLYPLLARKAVEDVDKTATNGITNNALYKQLMLLGALGIKPRTREGEKPEDQSTQVRYDPVAGKSARVIVIRYDAFVQELDPVVALAKELGL